MDLNYDNDWYRYFGNSTIYFVGRGGSAVYGLDDPATEASAPQKDPADAVRQELAENPGDDKD